MSILLAPYYYLIACLIILVADWVKNRKFLLIIMIFFMVLLMGWDEFLVNKTINRPNYSCNVDTDCSVKTISRGWCDEFSCVNDGWEYYNSFVSKVLGLSCAPTLYTCSCVQNKCVSNNIYQSMNLDDCKNIPSGHKELCVQIISDNIESEESLNF